MYIVHPWNSLHSLNELSRQVIFSKPISSILTLDQGPVFYIQQLLKYVSILKRSLTSFQTLKVKNLLMQNHHRKFSQTLDFQRFHFLTVDGHGYAHHFPEDFEILNFISSVQIWMLQELGWKSSRNLSDMCRDMWNWQTKNPKGFAG